MGEVSKMDIINIKDLCISLQNYGNNIAKQLAIVFREELTREYKYSIEKFYDSYNPIYYDRTWQLRESGSPLYRKNNSGKSYRGGVLISTDKMKETHADPNTVVLSNSLEGFHGKPYLGIYTPPAIIDHILTFRDLLFYSVQEDGSDYFSQTAISRAK